MPNYIPSMLLEFMQISLYFMRTITSGQILCEFSIMCMYVCLPINGLITIINSYHSLYSEMRLRMGASWTIKATAQNGRRRRIIRRIANDQNILQVNRHIVQFLLDYRFGGGTLINHCTISITNYADSHQQIEHDGRAIIVSTENWDAIKMEAQMMKSIIGRRWWVMDG